MSKKIKQDNQSIQETIHQIIFEADTPMGKLFDIILIWAILFSILIVSLDSVEIINYNYGIIFGILEWIITIFFTLEYILRVYSVKKPTRYIFSFYGIIDLLSIIPTYVSIFFTGAQSLILIRAIRLLRVFRVLKLSHFMLEAKLLLTALLAAKRKIFVFFCTILTLVTVFGALMYVIEGPARGFSNILQSSYWAVVTMTTVGYGDITPHTPLGKFVAALLMISGYAIIAVPTGIISVHIAQESQKQFSARVCQHCGKEGHDIDAGFCKYCGEKINNQN